MNKIIYEYIYIYIYIYIYKYIYEIWYMRIDIYKRFHNWSQKCDFTKDSSMIKSVTALLLESDVFRVRV